MIVVKHIDTIYQVHFWTRAWGSESLIAHGAESVKEAIKDVKYARGLRKSNITGVEVYKMVSTFPDEGGEHDTKRCVCEKCTGRTNFDPPSDEEGWKREDGRWILPIEVITYP